MPLLDQIKEILALLEKSAEEIESWATYVEEQHNDKEYSEDAMKIVSQIRSVLHDVGF
jgi:regulator of RNase E activity RraB